jgi:hypothetical protein
MSTIEVTPTQPTGLPKVIDDMVKKELEKLITPKCITLHDDGSPNVALTMHNAEVEAGAGGAVVRWLGRLALTIIEQIIIDWILKKRKKDDPNNKDK